MVPVLRAASLCLLLVACEATDTPPPGDASGPDPEPVLQEYRGVLHVHSRYSHDSEGTYPEILAAAQEVGLDFVVMTDHPPREDPGLSLREGWRGIHGGVLFIQGAELSSQILAVGIREPIRARKPQAILAEVHAQGGLAFVCHGEKVEDWAEFAGFDGMEIYNTHTALKARQESTLFWARFLQLSLEDPDSAWSLLCEPQEALLGPWREERLRRPTFAAIAGNDAHQNVYGFDPYTRSLGFVQTHVWATELSEEALLEGLRQGRTSVHFRDFGDPEVAERAERAAGR